ncbi:hypothetical protein V2J09_020592 [Rumex salicifolius]
MMHMTFYWGIQVTVLFDFWKTQTWIDYSLTLLACFLFSVFYQYLDSIRLRLNPSAVAGESASQSPLLVRYTTAKFPEGGCAWRAASAVMFGVNSALGYMLMLAVMSFNGGVLIAVVVGLAVGFFLFRSSSSAVVDVDNACACA